MDRNGFGVVGWYDVDIDRVLIVDGVLVVGVNLDFYLL